MNAILMTLYAKPVDIQSISSRQHTGEWWDATKLSLNSARAIYYRLKILAGMYFRARSNVYYFENKMHNRLADLVVTGLVSRNSFGHYKVTQKGKDYMRKYRINSKARESLEVDFSMLKKNKGV